MSTWKMFALLGALVIAAVYLPAQAFDGDPASLLKAIGQQGAGGERRATFLEIKTSTLLNAPLESNGTLLFRAPDVLEKITAAPQRERVRIEGGTLTIEGVPIRGQTSRRVIALADVPLLAPLAESLRATLAGDLPTLLRHYDVTVTRGRRPSADDRMMVRSRAEAAKKFAKASETESAWTLTLVPRDPALRGAIERVVMHGIDAEIWLLEFIEIGGDRTELWITPVR